jgi:hypothetical protein
MCLSLHQCLHQLATIHFPASGTGREAAALSLRGVFEAVSEPASGKHIFRLPQLQLGCDWVSTLSQLLLDILRHLHPASSRKVDPLDKFQGEVHLVPKYSAEEAYNKDSYIHHGPEPDSMLSDGELHLRFGVFHRWTNFDHCNLIISKALHDNAQGHCPNIAPADFADFADFGIIVEKSDFWKILRAEEAFASL